MKLELAHLQAFLAISRRRSIQAAAGELGRSRTTLHRYLEDLRQAFDVAELFERAPGQRSGALTVEGETLRRRVEQALEYWHRWFVGTYDALEQERGTVRVGALAGAFDLLAEVLSDLRRKNPDVRLRAVEYPDEDLGAALESGAVDLAIGTVVQGEVIEGLRFEPFGLLPWAVIVPCDQASRFGERLRLRDLDGIPLVVMRSGAARRRLENYFAEYEGGPLVLNPAVEVGSSPRIVDMVARGFGPALVSRFRLAFVPPEVQARPLVDGPEPLVAGVFTRAGARLSATARELIELARIRFAASVDEA
jgi:DNA-binding transcriptional LysR family regulator